MRGDKERLQYPYFFRRLTTETIEESTPQIEKTKEQTQPKHTTYAKALRLFYLKGCSLCPNSCKFKTTDKNSIW